MSGLFRFFDGLFRFFYRLIATPILLGWMIGAMAFGAMLGRSEEHTSELQSPT